MDQMSPTTLLVAGRKKNIIIGSIVLIVVVLLGLVLVFGQKNLISRGEPVLRLTEAERAAVIKSLDEPTPVRELTKAEREAVIKSLKNN